MFDKMKALMDMQKKMQELKRQLDELTFDIESRDGLVRITMNGSQELKDIKIMVGKEEERQPLEAALKDAFSRAIKHSHDVAGAKMKEISGLNLPGLT